MSNLNLYPQTVKDWSDAKIAEAIEATESLYHSNTNSAVRLNLKRDIKVLKREQMSRQYHADPEDGLLTREESDGSEDIWVES